jgi:hypothetical protein
LPLWERLRHSAFLSQITADNRLREWANGTTETVAQRKLVEFAHELLLGAAQNSLKPAVRREDAIAAAGAEAFDKGLDFIETSHSIVDMYSPGISPQANAALCSADALDVTGCG